MSKRSGHADLPLHGGRVPGWLASRMSALGRVMAEAIVLHYGRHELLCRLAHPFWFQSFGAVMGMDWHSSGITTSVIGALKRGLEPVADELGIYVCGGRGKHSRKTPAELLRVGERLGIDGAGLARTSRLVAKVDSAAVQDHFALYLHGFILSADGDWTVVQQGMAPQRRLARRYHWHSRDVDSFVQTPHSAVAGPSQGPILNLVAREANAARAAQVKLLGETPARLLGLWGESLRKAEATPQLTLPHHHDVRASDVATKRLHATLAAATEAGPQDFPDLLLVPGVGPRTVEVLAHIASIVHGTPTEFDDPARFSFALGGKDGLPFPVPLAVYDKTLDVFRSAISNAKLGHRERLDAIARLDRQARALDGVVSGLPFESLIATERRRVSAFEPRTVFDKRTEPPRPGPKSKQGGQLALF
ncbi:MAG: DUF763 domain-containing protein [Gammaproteobacteria bacterium]|nr:DUF763 domain-containing protein [Gammaproteobacteria bacterium]